MAATLAKAGGTVVCQYLTIIDSAATGAEFYAGDSTDGGGNSGWVFTYPTTTGGAGARSGPGSTDDRGPSARRGPDRGTRGA